MEKIKRNQFEIWNLKFRKHSSSPSKTPASESIETYVGKQLREDIRRKNVFSRALPNHLRPTLLGNIWTNTFVCLSETREFMTRCYILLTEQIWRQCLQLTRGKFSSMIMLILISPFTLYRLIFYFVLLSFKFDSERSPIFFQMISCF